VLENSIALLKKKIKEMEVDNKELTEVNKFEK
jgi:hypothetical protein